MALWASDNRIDVPTLTASYLQFVIDLGGDDMTQEQVNIPALATLCDALSFRDFEWVCACFTVTLFVSSLHNILKINPMAWDKQKWPE